MTLRRVVLLLAVVVLCGRIALISWSGTVVVKGTGKPIAGAVILRSWKRYWFNPVHPVSTLVTFEEALTNHRGRFLLPGLRRALSFSIPVLGPIEANAALVFKAGYRHAWFRDTTQVLELEKLPETYAARRETLEKARFPDYVEFKDTSLWKAAIEREDAALRTLPRAAPGVFHHGKD
jgi:hypothetical protein